MSKHYKYPYVGIHNHTDFSNIRGLDCINKVPDLIDRCVELGHCGLAITDHETLGSHVRAIQYVKKEKENGKIPADFRLLLGNEIYLCRNGLNKDTYEREKDHFYHFILVAKDEIGYKQLRQLSSRAWGRSYKRYVTRVPTYYDDIKEIVGSNRGHLIASTACLGSFPGIHFDTEPERVEKFLKWNKSMFGVDFYLEIQPNSDESQVKYNKFLEKASERLGIPMIITTDTHYLRKEDRDIHKIFLNANDSEREVDDFYSSTYLMEWDDFEARLVNNGFSTRKIEKMCVESHKIAEKCEDFDLFRKQVVPRVPIEG